MKSTFQSVSKLLLVAFPLLFVVITFNSFYSNVVDLIESRENGKATSRGPMLSGKTNNDHNEPKNVKMIKEPVKSEKYAVISASTPYNGNYNYVFDLPLTVLAWKRIDFKCIVMIAGSEKEWKDSKPLRMIYDKMVELGARVYFIPGTDPDNSVMVGQNSRLFAACTLGLNPNDYLVLSDADLWPLTPKHYSLETGKILMSFNAYCCGHFTHKSKKYRMLPIGNLGTYVKTWLEIIFPGSMKIKSLFYKNDKCDDQFNASMILKYFAEEFGDNVYKKVIKGENSWYMDQHMASIRILNWIKRIKKDNSSDEVVPGNVDFIGRHMNTRVDRSHWVVGVIDSKQDSHILNDIYKKGNWIRMIPLLKLMYGEVSPEFKFCQDYFEKFSQVLAKS